MVTMRNSINLKVNHRFIAIAACLAGLLVIFVAGSYAPARASAGDLSSQKSQPAGEQPGGAQSPQALCSGGPTIDGILLDECFVESFMVGAASKSVTVWYTNNMASATRVVDGTTYTLVHGVTNDTLPQQVAGWGHEAWTRYYEIFNHHPFDTGCGNNINVRLEQGIGWSGIAYWAASGKCWIGIDSPTVNAGNAQTVVYHEFQHYLQYSYNSGCYKFLKDNYNSGKP
jgi:hypothetical protein